MSQKPAAKQVLTKKVHQPDESFQKDFSGMKEKSDQINERRAAAKAEPEQDIESLQGGEHFNGLIIELGNKKQLKIAPPPGVATNMIVGEILKDVKLDATNLMAVQIITTQIKAAMYLREIDGAPVNLPVTMNEVKALLNKIGDEGADALALVFQEYWAPKSLPELKVIKKY